MYWYEVRADGSPNNGGGFDKDSGNTLTDLRTTNATSTTPTIASNSYSFLSTDINRWVYVNSSAPWNPGFYQITGLAGTSAIVNAGIGSYVQLNRPTGPATIAGIGTSAAITTGRWCFDHTQSSIARTSGSDLIVDATVTRVYSPTYTFTTPDISNIINISGGVGWTQGFYTITGIAGSMAIINASPGLAGTTGGVWALGGANNSPSTAPLVIQTGGIWIKAGSYTTGTGFTIGDRTFLYGYNNLRGDKPRGDDRPLLLAGGPNITMIWNRNGASIMNSIAHIRISGNGYSNVTGLAHGNSRNQVHNVKASLCITGFNSSSNNSFSEAVDCSVGFSGGYLYGCVAIGCTSVGFSNGLQIGAANLLAIRCNIGFQGADLVLSNSIAYKCATGFYMNNNGCQYVNCVAVGCTTNGFNVNFWNNRMIQCSGYNNAANLLAGGYMQLDNFINLTQNPFNDPDNNDFRLNDLPGGGALLKANGGFGYIPGFSSVPGFEDASLLQSKRQFFTPNMTGGLGG